MWTAIPGETPIDPSGLKKRGAITNRTQLNEAEAANILKVVLKYLSKKPFRRSAKFDYSWMLKLHKEMMGDVWKWAGVVRTVPLNIGPPAHEVEPRLYALVDDLKLWEQTDSLIDQAVLLHHRAVWIHPFNNGNGRWARMLANIWLKLHGSQPTGWPAETSGHASTESIIRNEYLAAVKAGDQGGLEPLKEVHRR